MLPHHCWGRKQVPCCRSLVSIIHRKTRLKIRVRMKERKQREEKSFFHSLLSCRAHIFFDLPRTRSNMTGAIGNRLAPLWVALEKAMVLSSKDATSCYYSCFPNHLRRNLCCIITICKSLNIWCRKLITVSIFHSVVSDGICVAILHLQQSSKASMLNTVKRDGPTVWSFVSLRCLRELWSRITSRGVLTDLLNSHPSSWSSLIKSHMLPWFAHHGYTT